jgi:flagellar hook protein FlgE
MLRSLFSGISGLRSHQQMMDVTGNNIANVNTVGFKSSATIFQDTLSQLLNSAGAPQAQNGGTNPAQIGLGVKLAGISTNFGQGAAQSTGRSTDLMITGDGFFAVRNGGETLYTRAGSFSFDANGLLVDPQGAVVQGWTADSAGKIDTNSTVGNVQLPVGTLLEPKATTSVTLGGNLPADSTSPTPIVSSITGYDQQGNKVVYSTTFTKVSPTSWDVSVTDGTTTATQNLAFAADGSTPTPTSIVLGGATIDLSGVTSYAGGASVASLKQNGSALGSLQAFTLASDGTLIGVFSNGLKQPLGQLALANFNNPVGLEKVGNNDYRTTVNSGEPNLGTAGTGGRGSLQSGTLEMSNVDLAQEFTNLIISERGFQANSKVITASDEVLQDLVNLKR